MRQTLKQYIDNFGFDIVDIRRCTGRTSKLINQAVDQLFEQGETIFIDHYAYEEENIKHIYELYINKIKQLVYYHIEDLKHEFINIKLKDKNVMAVYIYFDDKNTLRAIDACK